MATVFWTSRCLYEGRRVPLRRFDIWVTGFWQSALTIEYRVTTKTGLSAVFQRAVIDLLKESEYPNSHHVTVASPGISTRCVLQVLGILIAAQPVFLRSWLPSAAGALHGEVPFGAVVNCNHGIFSFALVPDNRHTEGTAPEARRKAEVGCELACI